MTYTDFSAQLSSVIFCTDFFEADLLWKSAIAQGRTIYLFIDGQYTGDTKPLDSLLELWLGGAIV